MVFRRLRGYLLVLALEHGTKVFPAGSAAGLSVRLARRQDARFPGQEKPQTGRGRVAPVCGDSDDRHLAWMSGVPLASHLSHGGLQDEASFTIWLLSGIFAAWMIWAGTTWMERISALVRPAIGGLRMDSLRISQVLALAALVGLIVVGLTQQLQMGRANLDLNSNTNRPSPEAEAGTWINSHTDPSAVVMARQVPSIYHYARRKSNLVPPSSNPQTIDAGHPRS